MLVFKVNIIIDFYNNDICVIVKLFGIKILKINISIFGLYIKINNSKKIKALNIFLDKEQEYLILQMKKSIIDKLYFDKISFYSDLGFGNACNTTIAVSYLDCLCYFIKNSLNKKIKDCDIAFKNQVDFVYEKIYLNLNFKVYFTIFDLVFAIVMSFYKRGKYVKERKQKSRK